MQEKWEPVKKNIKFLGVYLAIKSTTVITLSVILILQFDT